MRISLKYCCFVFVLLLNFLTSVAAYAADKQIQFNPVPTGLASRLVYDQWMKEPEYKDYTDFMKSPPHYMIAQGDVNDDGVDEVFARHADRDLDYCPQFGQECRLHIYKVVKGELIEIGRMYSTGDIVVTSVIHQGYHDLKIGRAGQKVTEYVWNGKTYAPK